MNRKLKLPAAAAAAVVLAGVVAACPPGASAQSGPAAGGDRAADAYTRATWLWDTPLIRSSAADILAFARENGLNAIYLQINRDLKPADYAGFIRSAGELGIEVDALNGRPSWGFAANRPDIELWLNWLSEYQRQAAPDARFAGIHVDVEPYAQSDWDAGGGGTVEQWQNNVRYIEGRARELKLPVNADLPFWLYTRRTPDGKETLSRWMMRHYDAVTILAYRDTAGTIAAAADKQLEEAADLGKPAVIGVETLDTGEGAWMTFFGKSPAYLSGQLARAETLLAHRHAFSGFAVHEYRAWKALK